MADLEKDQKTEGEERDQELLIQAGLEEVKKNEEPEGAEHNIDQRLDRLKRNLTVAVNREHEQFDKNLRLWPLRKDELGTEVKEVDIAKVEKELETVLDEIDKAEDSSFEAVLHKALPYLESARAAKQKLQREYDILNSELGKVEVKTETADYDFYKQRQEHKQKNKVAKLLNLPRLLAQRLKYSSRTKVLKKEKEPFESATCYSRLTSELKYGVGNSAKRLEDKLEEAFVRELAQAAWNIRHSYLDLAKELQADPELKAALGLNSAETVPLLELMIGDQAESQIQVLLKKIEPGITEQGVKKWVIKLITEASTPEADRYDYNRDPFHFKRADEQAPLGVSAAIDASLHRYRDDLKDIINNHDQEKYDLYNQNLETLLANQKLPKLLEVEQFEKQFADKLAQLLLSRDEDLGEAVGLGKYLFTLARHNSAVKLKYAPQLVMNAWRAGYKKDRGWYNNDELRYPFIPGDYQGGEESEIYKFLQSFTAAESEQLESLELKKILALVKNHPKNFHQSSVAYYSQPGTALEQAVIKDRQKRLPTEEIEDCLVQDYAKSFKLTEVEAREKIASYLRGIPDAELLTNLTSLLRDSSDYNGHVTLPNLTHLQLEHALGRLCTDMLKTADADKQYFALGLFKKLRTTQLGPETDGIVRKILLESKQGSLQNKLVETILTQGNDSEAALALARYAPQMPDVQDRRWNSETQEEEEGAFPAKAKLEVQKQAMEIFMICLNTQELSLSGADSLGSILGREPGQVKETFEFMRGLIRIYGLQHVKACGKLEKAEEDLFSLPDKSKILQMVEDLKRISGYQFYISNIPQLQKWEHKREYVLQVIERLVSKNFKWKTGTAYMDSILEESEKTPALLNLIEFLIANGCENNLPPISAMCAILGAENSLESVFTRIRAIFPQYQIESNNFDKYLKLLNHPSLTASNADQTEAVTDSESPRKADILDLVATLAEYGFSRFSVWNLDGLNELFTATNKAELMSFMADLHKYGYQFQSMHMFRKEGEDHLLQKLLNSKDKILGELKEIKKVLPDFRYLVDISQEQNMPYDVFARTQDAMLVLRILHDQQKEIPSQLKGLVSQRPYDYLAFTEDRSEQSEDSKFEHPIPWGEMYLRLKSVQAPAERAEYDPWRTDLTPLVERALEQKLLDWNNPNDAEIVYDYIKRYDMINLELLFNWHVTISKANKLEDLAIVKDKLQNELGLDIEEIYKSKQCQEKIGILKSIILDRLESFKRGIQDELLKDQIPIEAENTEIGMEIFKMLRGRSRWNRNENVKEVWNVWRETLKTNPELAKLPEGYQEVTFQVPARVRRQETESEADKRQRLINKVVEDSDLAVRIEKFKEAHKVAVKIDNLTRWWSDKQTELLEGFNEQVAVIEQKMNLIPNEKAKVGMLKNVQGLQDILKQIASIEIKAVNGTELNKPALQAEDLLKQLLAFLPEKGYEELIRTISAFHSLAISDLEASGMRPMIEDTLTQMERANNLNEDIIMNWGSFLKDWLDQHYFGKEAAVSVTAFEKESLLKIRKAWGVSGKIDSNKICQSSQKIKNLLDSAYEISNKTIPITMVPVRGPLLQFGGYLGDACWTSQSMKLAKGELPGITGFVFVTGRGTKNEILRGSTLAIETKTADGKDGVLLVRANNPQEALGGIVDPDALVQNISREMKELAKRRKISITAVPLDAATSSSSNREYVSGYYARNYANQEQYPKVALENVPETNFNGYESWKTEGTHPVVRI